MKEFTSANSFCYNLDVDREEIKKRIRAQLPLLRAKYHVQKIGVFGSVIRGEQTSESDIDLVVEFTAPIGFLDFIRLENSLSEILGRKVDLISKKALKPAIRDGVLKEVAYV